MGSKRQEKVQERIRHIAADFISRHSNNASLITVTSVNVSPDFAHSTIYISVYPVEMEETALNFLKRSRSAFREHTKKELKLRILPFFDFEIDKGEKNRQLIEELSH